MPVNDQVREKTEAFLVELPDDITLECISFIIYALIVAYRLDHSMLVNTCAQAYLAAEDLRERAPRFRLDNTPTEH